MKYYATIRLILKLVGSLACPAVFIWAVNTLFGLGIPLTFKTWLASLLLFVTVRFFVTKSYYPVSYDDEYYESDEDEDEYEDEEYEEEEEGDGDDDGPAPDSSNTRRLRRVK